jgi:hypothetical protein
MGVGECEEQLAHGDFKAVISAVVWENAEKFRQLSDSSPFWGGSCDIKFNAFSNQNWPQGCHIIGDVVQHVDRDRSFSKVAAGAAA